MASVITGKAYVLGDDIDTDQIIPAEFLSYDPTDPEERKFFGMYAMVGVPPAQAGLPKGNTRFVEEDHPRPEFQRGPIAEAGVHAVVAEFYARIFFRNSVNGGYLLPCETEARISEEINTGDECTLDIEAGTLVNHTSGKTYQLKPLGDVKPIIDAGGVFNYARESGMLK